MSETLAHLLAALPQPQVIGHHGDLDITISAPVAESSADIEPGGLFVARRGQSADGHDFIPQAIERGAAAIIGEYEIGGLPVPYVQVREAMAATGYLAAAYHHYPSRKLRVIGVTGTDGKTTTSTLIHAILRQATMGKAGLISTLHADLGGKTADTGLHVTTPSAPQIQALLARMVANGLQYAVLEMTSHGLAQGRLNGIDVDAAVLTNLTHEHLDYHGTFEAYRAAKGRLFQMLATSVRKVRPQKYIAPDGSVSKRDFTPPKLSIINADDPNADYFVMFAADQRILYGLGERAHYRAVNIEYTPRGTSFAIEYPDDQILGTTVSGQRFFTPLLGEFNLYNALAAVETCIHLPLATQVVVEGLEMVSTIPGRLERIDAGQPYIALVDFAHTPAALRQVLTACRTMLKHGGRLIAVFGSAGLRDREKRTLMAETGIELADLSILTAEDPRTESLDDILATMASAATRAGGSEGTSFVRIPDRGAALLYACQQAKAGDVVIACGKGHEQSMCFGTTEYPWDDREALRAALGGTPPRTLPTSQS
jgi:UDP-N-acetylmuramoyl-L-alanyl-D-glutamate--2,6-diaminopimelate ligase